MSKYVPPCMKESQNRFSALDANPSETKEAWRPRSTAHPEPSRYPEPRMTSGTMASLTKGKSSSNSYASNFAEQARLRNDPNYVPPQKPVNIASDDDFPTLCVPKKVQPIPGSSTGQNFIQMAEGWGKKIKDEEEANRQRIRKAEEERRITAKENYLKEKYGNVEDMPKIACKNKLILASHNDKYYDKKEGKLKSINDVVEEDSFESGPSHDEEEEDDDDESHDDEFNTNIGYERRHRDELY